MPGGRPVLLPQRQDGVCQTTSASRDCLRDISPDPSSRLADSISIGFLACAARRDLIDKALTEPHRTEQRVRPPPASLGECHRACVANSPRPRQSWQSRCAAWLPRSTARGCATALRSTLLKRPRAGRALTPARTVCQHGSPPQATGKSEPPGARLSGHLPSRSRKFALFPVALVHASPHPGP